ncbi:hypothetical protein JRI60_24880 [Archangium violaceum]|uniref:hypothetical protein n=1 Tax=Archangium violaceum TaxID=83451 RepID=UPI00194F4A92|nr:hypothetical protein [Archangium violaceum]QRO02018.1 hypothetical protein JRI60_24880 [Archangium violaceum]
MTSPRRVALRVTLFLTTSLFPLSLSAAQPGEEIVVPTYGFPQVESLWQAATGGRPLEASLITVLTTHLGQTSSGGGGGGGGIEYDFAAAAPRASATTTGPILPVVSLEASLARTVHERTARLDLLLGAVQGYRSEADSMDRSIALETWSNAAHLELFLTNTAVFLEGQTREQKCLSYERAADHARFLGWTRQSPTGGPVQARVPTGWESLRTAASSFFSNSFVHHIPDGICSLQRAIRKSEVEQTVRGAVDQAIAVKVGKEMDAALQIAQRKLEDYASAGQASHVEVPTREIFALKKSVSDTRPVHDFVVQDKLMLYSVPQGSQKQPLVADLEDRQKRISAIISATGAAELSAEVASARATRDAHTQFLSDTVTLLREMAVTPGLSTSARDRVKVCVTLPAAVTPQNLESLAAQLNTCLAQLATVYTELKAQSGTRPGYGDFAQKLDDLSSAYVDIATRGQ